MKKSYITTILDWTLVLVFCTFLFLSFELMPLIWQLLKFLIGSNVNAIPVLSMGFILGFLLIFTIFIKKQKRFSSYAWFIILVAYTSVVCRYVKSPYDRMHLVEYYMLGLFFYRLLTNYIYNNMIYILSLILTTLIGIVDEVVQLFTAYRSFSVADIGVNFAAVLLAQLSIALVIKPDFSVSVPKLRRKVDGLHAQEVWLSKHEAKNID